MQAEKKVPPKPEGLKKKEERDTKYAEVLKKAREERRIKNKEKKALILKKAQDYEAKYAASIKSELELTRKAKANGEIYVPAQAKVAFVVRIRGVNKLNPKVIRILRLLRLRQIFNGTFVKINKASENIMRRVEPYITFGYPSRETIKRLVYKRGYAKSERQRLPLTNELIEKHLGKIGVVCYQDVVNELYTVGPNFKQVNNFLWPFKLHAPRGGFAHKRHPFQRRGDWGNREVYINDLVKKML